jgi:hypothetical protein
MNKSLSLKGMNIFAFRFANYNIVQKALILLENERTLLFLLAILACFDSLFLIILTLTYFKSYFNNQLMIAAFIHLISCFYNTHAFGSIVRFV